MGNTMRKGGAMGRGCVYIVKGEQSEYKSGSSKDLTKILKEININEPKTKLFKAPTESDAQIVNPRIRSKWEEQDAMDWFHIAMGKSWKAVAKTTRNSVHRHNRSVKTRGKTVISKKRNTIHKAGQFGKCCDLVHVAPPRKSDLSARRQLQRQHAAEERRKMARQCKSHIYEEFVSRDDQVTIRFWKDRTTAYIHGPGLPLQKYVPPPSGMDRYLSSLNY